MFSVCAMTTSDPASSCSRCLRWSPGMCCSVQDSTPEALAQDTIWSRYCGFGFCLCWIMRTVHWTSPVALHFVTDRYRSCQWSRYSIPAGDPSDTRWMSNAAEQGSHYSKRHVTCNWSCCSHTLFRSNNSKSWLHLGPSWESNSRSAGQDAHRVLHNIETWCSSYWRPVQLRVISCVIPGGGSGTKTGSLRFFGSHSLISSPLLPHTHYHIFGSADTWRVT
jgi:hypothetical protein